MINKKNGKDEKKNDFKKVAQFKLNLDLKNSFFIFFIVLFLFFAYQSISKEVKQALPEKSITTVVQEIKDQKVKKMEIVDNKILIFYKDDTLGVTYKEASDSFLKTVRDAGVNPGNTQIVVKDTQGSNGLVNFLSNIIPTILMVGFFIFLFRQARGAQDSVFSFGQS